MTFGNAVNATSSGYQSITSGGVWNGRTFQAGAGISLTNADGTAGNTTIASSGGGMTWSDKAVSFNAAVSNGYFVTAAATATLPAAPAEGDIIVIDSVTSGAVVVTANSGQTISLGSSTSASAGNLTSTAKGDSLTLNYYLLGTTWIARGVQGNWIIN